MLIGNMFSKCGSLHSQNSNRRTKERGTHRLGRTLKVAEVQKAFKRIDSQSSPVKNEHVEWIQNAG